MDLSYQILRSPTRKKLTTVERDRSIIDHAPESTAEEEIHRVVDSKRQWLFEKVHHPQKYQAPAHPPGKEVVNGESAPYLGREYLIEVTETASGQVEFFRRFLVPPAQQKNRKKVLKAWFGERSKETIIPLAERYARELGAQFGAVRIVDNRYRWGF